MSEPYSETIVQAIVTALGAISAGSGDAFTPTRVVRRDRIDAIEPNCIQVAWLGETKEPPAGSSGPIVPRYEVALALRILSALIDVPADPSATDRQVSLRARDIERALISIDWLSLNALLVGIDAAQFRDDETEIPWDGIVVDLEIRYQVDSDDTTQVLDYMSK